MGRAPARVTKKAVHPGSARDGGTERGGEGGGVRERVLAAATAVLREAGIRGLSQVRVARRAGVRQSHLTYYFPHRQDLVEAVALRFVEGVVHGAAATPAGAATEPAHTAAAIRRLAAAIADPVHMRMFAGLIVEADADPELRMILTRVTLRMRSTLAGLLGSPGGTTAAESRAEFVLAALWGLGLYQFVLRPDDGPARASAFVARLTGAAAASPAAGARPARPAKPKAR